MRSNRQRHFIFAAQLLAVWVGLLWVLACTTNNGMMARKIPLEGSPEAQQQAAALANHGLPTAEQAQQLATQLESGQTISQLVDWANQAFPDIHEFANQDEKVKLEASQALLDANSDKAYIKEVEVSQNGD